MLLKCHIKGHLFLADMSYFYLQEKDYGLWNVKGSGRKTQLWDVT